MNLLTAVKISNKVLKKKTKIFEIPFKEVNFKTTKLITVTDIANTLRNPVFMPKIKNKADIISLRLFAGKFERTIFSGDANLGTLRMAFIKNNINKVTDTFLRWFCKRGNLTRIDLPKIIP